MSQTEIDRAVSEAKMFAAADKARKDAVDARNEAESIVVQIEKNIKDVDGKIKDDDKVLLESDVRELKDLLDSHPIESLKEGDAEIFKAAKDKLLDDSNRVFSTVYQNGTETEAECNENADMDENDDDNIVDGEFKEV